MSIAIAHTAVFGRGRDLDRKEPYQIVPTKTHLREPQQLQKSTMPKKRQQSVLEMERSKDGGDGNVKTWGKWQCLVAQT